MIKLNKEKFFGIEKLKEIHYIILLKFMSLKEYFK
jgi:hypothetical protein